MSSSWIRTAAKYALMLLPTALLALLVLAIVLGTWIASILNDPPRYRDAPGILQNLTRMLYWQTRYDWQGLSDCAEFDPVTLYRPRPGPCRFVNAEFDTVMRFDGTGARVTALPDEDLVGRQGAIRRLVVLGDSFAMGWGVADDETFASYLASNHGFQTINLAVSSFGTARELLHLRQRHTLAPEDMIVIQYCDNDYEENLHFMTHGRVGPYVRRDLEPIQDRRPIASEPMPVAGRLMRLTFRQVIRTLSDWRSNPPADHASPGAALLTVLGAFPDARARRIVVVPINEHGRTSHLGPEKELLETAGIQLILPDFSGDLFFPIDGHLTPAGHVRVARDVAQAAALADFSP